MSTPSGVVSTITGTKGLSDRGLTTLRKKDKPGKDMLGRGGSGKGLSR